jgi:hypothetical protein
VSARGGEEAASTPHGGPEQSACAGTLAVKKNGKFLGVAATGLAGGGGA